jgi:hypothetical protein
MDANNATLSAVRRLVPVFPNKHFDELKLDPWPQVLGLLGKGGDRVMIDLLVDCGIFLAAGNGRGNYFQICGMYLHAEAREVTEFERFAARRPPNPGSRWTKRTVRQDTDPTDR